MAKFRVFDRCQDLACAPYRSRIRNCTSRPLLASPVGSTILSSVWPAAGSIPAPCRILPAYLFYILQSGSLLRCAVLWVLSGGLSAGKAALHSRIRPFPLRQSGSNPEVPAAHRTVFSGFSSQLLSSALRNNELSFDSKASLPFGIFISQLLRKELILKASDLVLFPFTVNGKSCKQLLTPSAAPISQLPAQNTEYQPTLMRLRRISYPART